MTCMGLLATQLLLLRWMRFPFFFLGLSYFYRGLVVLRLTDHWRMFRMSGEVMEENEDARLLCNTWANILIELS